MISTAKLLAPFLVAAFAAAPVQAKTALTDTNAPQVVRVADEASAPPLDSGCFKKFLCYKPLNDDDAHPLVKGKGITMWLVGAGLAMATGPFGPLANIIVAPMVLGPETKAAIKLDKDLLIPALAWGFAPMAIYIVGFVLGYVMFWNPIGWALMLGSVAFSFVSAYYLSPVSMSHISNARIKTPPPPEG